MSVKTSMKTKSKLAFLIAVFGLLSFFAGGLAYRGGIFSAVKKSLRSMFSTEIPVTSPTLMPTDVPVIKSSFPFEFLDNPSVAAMNKKSLDENSRPLKFLVAGHIYGKPDEDDFHPAMTFLTNLALFRQTNFDMFIFLGDTVWTSTNENFDNLEYFILNRVEVPIFNAVGNHDVIQREVYEKRYGSTTYAFQYKENLFIVLDTTLKYYDITSIETTFVEKIIKDYTQAKDIKRIHVMMHHVLFLDDDEIIGKQIIKPNEGNGMSESFRCLLEDVIYPASTQVPVYIYAGDVGAFEGGNLSPMYKKDENHDVFFLTTGLGNTEADSVLIMEENLDGRLIITPISLIGNKMMPIENYDFEYWLKK